MRIFVHIMLLASKCSLGHDLTNFAQLQYFILFSVLKGNISDTVFLVSRNLNIYEKEISLLNLKRN
jgi:hypothetical protein